MYKHLICSNNMNYFLLVKENLSDIKTKYVKFPSENSTSILHLTFKALKAFKLFFSVAYSVVKANYYFPEKVQIFIRLPFCPIDWSSRFNQKNFHRVDKVPWKDKQPIFYITLISPHGNKRGTLSRSWSHWYCLIICFCCIKCSPDCRTKIYLLKSFEQRKGFRLKMSLWKEVDGWMY